MGQEHAFCKDTTPDMSMLSPSWGSLFPNFAFISSFRTSIPKREELQRNKFSEMRCRTLLCSKVYGFPLFVRKERLHQIRLLVKFRSK